MSMIYENKDVPKIKATIQKQAMEMGPIQRFGYFSIPYGSHVGDQFYSVAKKVVLDENKHVKTEKKNFLTNPVRQGKGPDVYFSNMVYEDKDTLKRSAELAKKEQEEYLEKSKSRHKGSANAKEFKVSFKPSGPQEYHDFFDEVEQKKKVMNQDKPVYSPPPRKSKYNHETKKVEIEQKNIFTAPPRQGTSSTPGILFSAYTTMDLKVPKKRIHEEIIPFKQREKPQFKMPFKPAALKKCEPFMSDQGIYQEEKERLKSFEKDSKILRENPRPKFAKEKLPVNHPFPFKPPHFGKIGRDGMFQKEGLDGIPFIPFEKKVIANIKEANKKAFKLPFKNNLLMQASKFSPAISGYIGNLKKEFPSVFSRSL